MHRTLHCDFFHELESCVRVVDACERETLRGEVPLARHDLFSRVCPSCGDCPAIALLRDSQELLLVLVEDALRYTFQGAFSKDALLAYPHGTCLLVIDPSRQITELLKLSREIWRGVSLTDRLICITTLLFHFDRSMMLLLFERASRRGRAIMTRLGTLMALA